MSNLFEPMSKEEFFESVDRGLEQSRNGQARDAFESLDEIEEELEAGYQAMVVVQASEDYIKQLTR